MPPLFPTCLFPTANKWMNDSQALGLSHISEGRKTAYRQLQSEAEKDFCGKLNLATSPGASDSEPHSAQLHAQTTTNPGICQTSTTQPTWSSTMRSWGDDWCSHKATSNEDIIFYPKVAIKPLFVTLLLAEAGRLLTSCTRRNGRWNQVIIALQTSSH